MKTRKSVARREKTGGGITTHCCLTYFPHKKGLNTGTKYMHYVGVFKAHFTGLMFKINKISRINEYESERHI